MKKGNTLSTICADFQKGGGMEINMRILIISDTHGKTSCIRDVLDTVGEIDMLIHLGDICGDEEFIREHCDCELHMIAGNNDWGTDLPASEEFMIGDKRAYIVHGHRQMVHYGTDVLKEYIDNDGYDFVMYGHTHVRNLEEYKGAYIVNPGSLALPRDSRYGTYMLLEFDQNGKPFFADNELQTRRKRQQSFWEDFFG